MTVNAVLTPSMTSSNSMSSGYCSLDDETEDFSFFTAKTSFFRKPRQPVKVQNRDNTLTLIDEILRVRQTQMGPTVDVSVSLGNRLLFTPKTHCQIAEVVERKR